MKLKELYEQVKVGMEAGFGDADVVHDTEAKHYTCHLVDVIDAHHEDYGDEHMGKHFILFDNHGHTEESEYWYYKPLYELREKERDAASQFIHNVVANTIFTVDFTEEWKTYKDCRDKRIDFQKDLISKGYNIT